VNASTGVVAALLLPYEVDDAEDKMEEGVVEAELIPAAVGVVVVTVSEAKLPVLTLGYFIPKPVEEVFVRGPVEDVCKDDDGALPTAVLATKYPPDCCGCVPMVDKDEEDIVDVVEHGDVAGKAALDVDVKVGTVVWR